MKTAIILLCLVAATQALPNSCFSQRIEACKNHFGQFGGLVQDYNCEGECGLCDLCDFPATGSVPECESYCAKGKQVCMDTCEEGKRLCLACGVTAGQNPVQNSVPARSSAPVLSTRITKVQSSKDQTRPQSKTKERVSIILNDVQKFIDSFGNRQVSQKFKDRIPSINALVDEMANIPGAYQYDVISDEEFEAFRERQAQMFAASSDVNAKTWAARRGYQSSIPASNPAGLAKTKQRVKLILDDIEKFIDSFGSKEVSDRFRARIPAIYAIVEEMAEIPGTYNFEVISDEEFNKFRNNQLNIFNTSGPFQVPKQFSQVRSF